MPETLITTGFEDDGPKRAAHKTDDDRLAPGKSRRPLPQQPEERKTPDNPFDPRRLRLTQNFRSTSGVKRAFLTVPARKPSRESFVRTHPDETHYLETGFIELKDDRELYLVAPELWDELAVEPTFGFRALFTSITRQGTVFLWPVKLPGPDGKSNDWFDTAMEAAKLARTSWVRLTANMELQAYDTYVATVELPEPEWPETSLEQLLSAAFKNRFINDLDHAVLRRLRGEA